MGGEKPFTAVPWLMKTRIRPMTTSCHRWLRDVSIANARPKFPVFLRTMRSLRRQATGIPVYPAAARALASKNGVA